MVHCSMLSNVGQAGLLRELCYSGCREEREVRLSMEGGLTAPKHCHPKLNKECRRLLLHSQSPSCHIPAGPSHFDKFTGYLGCELPKRTNILGDAIPTFS